jgi:hypothetical protein
MKLIEHTFINMFNRVFSPNPRPLERGLPLGQIVGENGITETTYYLPTVDRAKHLSIWGKTGSGKSSFIRHLVQHDIRSGHGFVLVDLHGDLIPATMRLLAERKVDPARVIVIDPTSTEWAVGMNPLEASDETARYLQCLDVVRTIMSRWEFTGAQTEELLRNALLVLSENGLTLLEVSALLANDAYRAGLLKKVTNTDVKEFFELRFDPLSDAMKARMREPVLNKLSEMTSDPHFHFILGQPTSTISFDNVLNLNLIVLVNLPKGTLGMHCLTFGGLFFNKIIPAIFRRRSREIFSIYADEMQNLVGDVDFEGMFSETRKFGVSIVSANQFAAQLPAKMKSALQAIGTRIFFQLSPEDAEQVAREIGGNKTMVDRLKNLPPRHFIAKQGNHKPYQVITPDVITSKASAVLLYETSNGIHARRRSDIQSDILARRPKLQQTAEALHDWE